MVRVRNSTLIGAIVLTIILAPLVSHAFPAIIGMDHSYVVLSGSMEPAIGAGSVIWVKDVPAKNIEEGEVITFRNDDSGPPTTHRVVEVYGDGRLITQGDANEAPDGEPVEPDEVIGEVKFKLPLIGYFVIFAQTRLGMLTLIGVPSLMLVLNEVWDILVDEGDSKQDESGQTTTKR